MINTQNPAKLFVKKFERSAYNEYYFTAIMTVEAPLYDQVEALYAQVLHSLKQHEIQVIQEKVHGSSTVREAFEQHRKTVYIANHLDASIPYTYVEGRPLSGQKVVSLQVWGVQLKDPNLSVRTEWDSVAPVRIWEGSGFKYVYAPCIHGLDPRQPDNEVCVHRQCSNMFERATHVLNRYGMSFKEVVRTWIYSARLLDWYGELNRVRTEHFRKVGLYESEQRPRFPASTGIQGRFSSEECFFDVLALDFHPESGICMTPVNASSRQEQAFDYGSSFSRGMVVEHDGNKTVYVSGTAAINSLGDSIYIGDAEMQALDTLLNIAALLEDQGGSLHDIVSGVVYCKNHEAYDAYQRAMKLLQIPSLPLVCVGADVCRHELLIEIEVVAVVRAG
ncbi:MAG: Rid family hydrolase [Puniceicoccaceae bacterium]